jgi:hypothetical protein
LVLAEIDETDAEARLRLHKARYTTSRKGEKVTDIRAECDADPFTEQRQDGLDKSRAYRKLMSVLFESTTRDSAALSRELSRRIGTAELANRTRKWRA